MRMFRRYGRMLLSRRYKTTRKAYRAYGRRGPKYSIYRQPLQVGVTNRAVKPAARYGATPFPVQGMALNTFFTWSVDTPATALGGLCNGELRFTLNDLWDPNAGIGGSTARWNGTLQRAYKRYIIHTATVTVDFFSRQNTTAFPDTAFMAFRSSDQLSVNWNGKGAQEIPSYPTATVVDCPNQDAGTNARIVKTFKLWEIEGLTYSQYMARWDLYGNLFNASPSRSIQLVLGCFSNAGFDGRIVTCRVQIAFKGRAMQLNTLDFE